MEDLWVNPGKFPGIRQQILGKVTHFQAWEGQEANGNSHLRFITDKSCVTSLMASVMTGSVDEERALGVIYLDFSKAIISLPCTTGQGWHSKETPQTQKMGQQKPH